MRFGRVIILAGLAPLLSLSAVAAALASAPALPEPSNKRSLVEFLRSVAVLVAPEAPSISAPSAKASPHAVLAVDALALTPLRHSLWMLAPSASAALPSRAPLRSPLRC